MELNRAVQTTFDWTPSHSPAKASGDHRRSKVDAAIGRHKRVIGDAGRSGEDARRAREVKIAVKALTRVLELGRPICVRVA